MKNEEIIDSLQQVILSQAEKIEILDNHITWKIFLTSFVIILLFIIERIWIVVVNRRQSKRLFYQEIVVKPYMIDIMTFYEEILKLFDDIYKDISEVDNLKATDFEKYRRDEVQKIKDEKIDFHILFVSMIQKQYPKIGDRLSTCLLELEDLLTECLQDKKVSEIDARDMKREIFKNKAKFMSLLSGEK